LAKVGYSAFSVQAVASRARTGKASIYRRWPTKFDIVSDPLRERLPAALQHDLTSVVEESSSTADALRHMTATLSRVLDTQTGRILRSLTRDPAIHPDLSRQIDDCLHAPVAAVLSKLLRRSVNRGEIPAIDATPLLVEHLSAVLSGGIQREPATRRHLVDIVDQVLIPFLAAR